MKTNSNKTEKSATRSPDPQRKVILSGADDSLHSLLASIEPEVAQMVADAGLGQASWFFKDEASSIIELSVPSHRYGPLISIDSNAITEHSGNAMIESIRAAIKRTSLLI